LVERRGHPLPSALPGEQIEVEGAPVGQQQRLVSLSIVGLEISPAGLALVDAEPSLALDAQDQRTIRVVLAEGTPGPLVLPARPAPPAAEEALAAGVLPDQLSHDRA